MRKLAYVFPGQGSQSLGMLEGNSPEVIRTYEEASDAIGYDVWELVNRGPEKKLNQTEYTQPALLTVSVALFRFAMKNGAPRPDVVLGHSLGEYAALVASGVIRFDEAVRLVQKRGQHMQEAVPEGEGGMAAIMGLAEEELEQVCVSVSNLSRSGLVEPANYNAPGQVVVAGDLETLNSLIEKCKGLGARRAIVLKVSAPFHCSLMEPAAEKMKLHLEKVDLLPPEIPLIQNVSARYEREPEVLRTNLVEQIRKPVKWTDSVRLLEEEGVLDFVECGPGKVLSGLVKRTNRAATCVSFGSELELANLTVFGDS